MAKKNSRSYDIIIQIHLLLTGVCISCTYHVEFDEAEQNGIVFI